MQLVLIQTIALLCQLSAVEPVNGKGWTKLNDVAKYQLECQQQYIKCARKQADFSKCVEERSIE